MIRMQLTKCRRVIGKDEIATELRNGYEKSTSLRALAESIGQSYGFVPRGDLR